MFRKIILTVLVLTLSAGLAWSAKVVHVDYYPNGAVKVELIKLKKGLHRVNHYFESGALMETGYLKNGMFQGRWERYTEEGDLTSTAYYHNNVKIGAWNHVNQWNENTFQVYYDNGEAVSFKEYDPDGKLIASGSSVR